MWINYRSKEKSLDPDQFTSKFHQIVNEQTIWILCTHLENAYRGNGCSYLGNEVSIMLILKPDKDITGYENSRQGSLMNINAKILIGNWVQEYI